MTYIKYCNDGCSTVAFCVSPTGEALLKKHYQTFSSRLKSEAIFELRQALYEPTGDADTEIHDKDGAILRIWSHCKWRRHNVTACFISSLVRNLPPEHFIYYRIGSENLHDTVQAGNYFDNPFRLWTQRRFAFLDDANQLCTTSAEKREREKYLTYIRFWPLH